VLSGWLLLSSHIRPRVDDRWTPGVFSQMQAQGNFGGTEKQNSFPIPDQYRVLHGL
jgi:hypothetical protein